MGLSEEQKALGKRMLAHLYWTKSASVKYIQAFSFTELGEICKFQDLNYSRGASVKSHAFQGIIRQEFFQIFNPESGSCHLRKKFDPIDLLTSYVLVLTLYADDSD